MLHFDLGCNFATFLPSLVIFIHNWVAPYLTNVVTLHIVAPNSVDEITLQKEKTLV